MTNVQTVAPKKRSAPGDRLQKSASAFRRSPWSPLALLDQAFFIFAGLASFWLAWLVWRESWSSGGWWAAGLFVFVWAIVAYLALPRLHRILSSIYVPNYFIGRTRTADGLLGDPVNVALRGSEAQIHQAMQAAGWTLADEITARSSWQIIVSTLTGRSYDRAPVSSLFLFGRRQDFAYQQEVDGSPGKRHHVRFWRCPAGWLLPGGHNVDWLAAGTYDRSVGLSLFTLQVTHKIDANTDIERDYIVATVREATPAVTVTNLKDFSTGYHSRNGGGDSIQTDGDLPVLELGEVAAESSVVPRSELILDATQHDSDDDEHRTLIEEFWSRRPPQISFGILLVVVSALVLALSIVVEMTAVAQLKDDIAQELLIDGTTTTLQEAAALADSLTAGSVVFSVGWVLIVLLLARMVFRGANRSRIILMISSSVAIITASLSLTVGRLNLHSMGLLAFIALNITIILMLSSDAARQFTRTRSASRTRRGL